jgi:hypothetical protein
MRDCYEKKILLRVARCSREKEAPPQMRTWMLTEIPSTSTHFFSKPAAKGRNDSNDDYCTVRNCTVQVARARVSLARESGTLGESDRIRQWQGTAHSNQLCKKADFTTAD